MTGSDSRTKINLNTIFSAAINLPRCPDPDSPSKGVDGSTPLYPAGINSKRMAIHGSKWQQAANNTYNSPSNACVVSLCRDCANVLYWFPPIKDGIMARSEELAGAYYINGKAKSLNSRDYRWENAGLRSLVEPFVLCNLEEIWIDIDFFNCPAYAQYYNLLKHLLPGQTASADFLSAILEQEISTPSKPRTIASTFPLLRAIVAVSTPPHVSDFHKCTVRTDSMKNYFRSMSPHTRCSVGESPEFMSRLAKTSGFGFAVCPISSGYIGKFSLGDYKLDSERLENFREGLLSLYHTASPNSKNGNASFAQTVYNQVIRCLSPMGYFDPGDGYELERGLEPQPFLQPLDEQGLTWHFYLRHKSVDAMFEIQVTPTKWQASVALTNAEGIVVPSTLQNLVSTNQTTSNLVGMISTCVKSMTVRLNQPNQTASATTRRMSVSTVRSQVPARTPTHQQQQRLFLSDSPTRRRQLGWKAFVSQLQDIIDSFSR